MTVLLLREKCEAVCVPLQRLSCAEVIEVDVDELLKAVSLLANTRGVRLYRGSSCVASPEF